MAGAGQGRDLGVHAAAVGKARRVHGGACGRGAYIRAGSGTGLVLKCAENVTGLKLFTESTKSL